MDSQRHLSSRYWLFIHQAGWAYQLQDLVASHKTLADLHDEYNRLDDHQRGTEVFLFDLHTGRLCSWPALNDDGDVILTDEGLDAYMADAQINETKTIPFVHMKGEWDNPLRKNIQKYLASALQKRFFVFIYHRGWAGPGLQDLCFTSDSPSLPYLRSRARRACEADQVITIFDTAPPGDSEHEFIEIEQNN